VRLTNAPLERGDLPAGDALAESFELDLGGSEFVLDLGGPLEVAVERIVDIDADAAVEMLTGIS
jgi:hypothetical protein